MQDNTIIHLNVGGVHFTTLLGTLRKFPESMLAQQFSGNSVYLPRDTRDASNPFFLDRNGEVFGLLLDYLRSGVLLVPRDPLGYCNLRREATYWRLPIASQLPQVQPSLWEVAPRRFKHARVVVNETDTVVEWEEGTLPPELKTLSLEEIVKFFGGKGYRIASEYASRGSRPLSSLWLIKEEVSPGADVPIELLDSRGEGAAKASLLWQAPRK